MSNSIQTTVVENRTLEERGSVKKGLALLDKLDAEFDVR
jgi:hypothetical protein